LFININKENEKKKFEMIPTSLIVAKLFCFGITWIW